MVIVIKNLKERKRQGKAPAAFLSRFVFRVFNALETKTSVAKAKMRTTLVMY